MTYNFTGEKVSSIVCRSLYKLLRYSRIGQQFLIAGHRYDH